MPGLFDSYFNHGNSRHCSTIHIRLQLLSKQAAFSPGLSHFTIQIDPQVPPIYRFLSTFDAAHFEFCLNLIYVILFSLVQAVRIGILPPEEWVLLIVFVSINFNFS